jgi:TRAP-type mannitol/chloroaromatic compound transport system substrate-binding protein
MVPPMIPIAKLAQNWGKMIKEKSGGRVKFTCYWSRSLMAQQEIFKSVQTGVVDVSYYPLSPNFQPLSYFAYLPLMGFTSMSQGTEIYHKIYDQFPAIRDEYKV